MDEVRTTISLTAGLHIWLRHYAIDRRVSLTRLILDILMEWAKAHGYSEG